MAEEKKKDKKRWFRRWSKISMYHYYKLLARSVLLLVVLAAYIVCRLWDIPFFSFRQYRYPLLTRAVWVIWALYMVEMFLRLGPSRVESMGCQKQFAQNFKLGKDIRDATRNVKISLQEHMYGNLKDMLIGRRTHGRVEVFVAWVLLNGFIGVLYFNHIIDEGILMIIAMFYSVSDMICILFFCPFQTWFMKNRCCCNCYIYNWDYAMMFTPLIFIPHVYTYSLVFMSLLIVVQWEFKIRFYPERFDSRTNDALQCRNCTEKLCRHKKQLQGFIRTLEKTARVEDNRILNIILGQNNEFDMFDEECK